ncbi:hypothetical protein BDP55DRAFT_615442 [Colletotrichum godetiae]|uniref:Uncharacterized protein n=1 Tax=Colletotrichum godetiae TaxID=1209918 RepID=A0AAJ0AF02_9PEZI|nr:uncharacterized protein BDP55DRAFT_615442 [Colletotrichum godetiae]KAK1672678.1 hypothetical protein BDP55DRAFT_615442 [Colletotrichum godetiae]
MISAVGSTAGTIVITSIGNATSVTATIATPPQLPNSTWAASANATWTAASRSEDPETSKRTSIGASVTLPPWPTFNSTQASLTGTVSIPVITSSATGISNSTSSASESFPWRNSTSRGSLTASIITVSGGSTITLWPTGATPSLTSMPSSMVYSGTTAITYTSIGSSRPPFPTTNFTTLPGLTGSGTWASGTLFQTSEPSETSNSTSSTVNSPPFPTTGNFTTIPRPTWIPGTASGFPVTTLTTTGVNGSTTQTLTIVSLPSFPTSNGTATLGATGTSAGTGGSATWGGTDGPFSAPTDSSSTWGQWPNSTASTTVSATGQLNHHLWSNLNDSFHLDRVRIRLLFCVYITCTYTLAFQLICSSDFFRHRTPLWALFNPFFYPWTFTNSTGLPPGTPSPCNTITFTNGTVTQVVTTSILITSATASADPTTLAYPPASSNNTAHPPRSSCTSRWQNITIASSAGFKSTWTSSVQTNRPWTSVDPATTFITSTTSRLSDPSRDSGGIPDTSFSVAGTPTMTVSNVPLPSSPAYPWGGLGPIFRHYSGTDPVDDDTGSPDGPVVQERSGIWWARWKKNMDRLASPGRARNRGA